MTNMDASVCSLGSRSSLLAFLNRSKKNRTASIDSTVLSLSENTADSEGELRQSRHHACAAPKQGFYSRTASYILHRNSNRSSMSYEPQGKAQEKPERVEDRFCTELNECEPERLANLREKRAKVSPIICYESDDDEEGAAAANPALKSRWEALQVQESLLGKDHPDVAFLLQQIGRLQCKSRLSPSPRRVLGTTPSLDQSHYHSKE